MNGSGVCSAVVGGNAKHEVTWIHSYVDAGKTKTFCIYDGPTEQSIRDAAETNGLPVDRIRSPGPRSVLLVLIPAADQR